MAEDEIIGVIVEEAGEFQSISQLGTSDQSVQIAFAVLVIGIIGIAVVYRFFSNWVNTQEFNYTKPHLSRFCQGWSITIFCDNSGY